METIITVRLVVRWIAQIGIGVSAASMSEIGLWFIIPWTISWAIYEATRS